MNAVVLSAAVILAGLLSAVVLTAHRRRRGPQPRTPGPIRDWMLFTVALLRSPDTVRELSRALGEQSADPPTRPLVGSDQG